MTETNTQTISPASTPSIDLGGGTVAPTSSAVDNTAAVTANPVTSTDVTSVTAVTQEAPKTDIPATETNTAENILGESKKTDAASDGKVTDAKAQDKSEANPETKTVESGKEGEAITLPTYELNLPENVAVDSDALSSFTKILGEIETSKLDHKGFQETGQKLVDMHVKGVQDSIERLNDYYVNFHEEQTNGWLKAFKEDPEMGGANLENTVANLRDAVENYASTSPDAKVRETQLAEFRQVMRDTGVGKNPALCRLLNNMDAQIRKFTTEADNGNGGNNRMVPAARPVPSKVKDYQRFYTGSNG